MALSFELQELSSFASNDEVHRHLGAYIAKHVLGVADGSAGVEIGALSTNYFSFTFSVSVNTANIQRHVFVKIPKVDMRGAIPKILPVTPADRQLALAEESSLRLLNEKWNGVNSPICWVKLCGTVPDLNAIVTERVFAVDAFSVFRRLDLRQRFGSASASERLQSFMFRFGQALGRFHQTIPQQARVFRLLDELPKLEFYCTELARITHSNWPDRVIRGLRSMGDFQVQGVEVPTLKGLDIRNVLVDEQDNLCLLDPGKTKLTFLEADLARFLMTYRILYWGSNLLLVFRTPLPQSETAFLDGYYSNNHSARSQLLSLCLLKEQLKHWYAALHSLEHLSWSPFLKRIVAATYVNPFYRRLIGLQIRSLSQ